MLEIQITSTDVSSGSVAITWCLDAETIQYLSQLNVQDPQVVICVAPTENYDIRREYRKVVPLKDLMTYVEFRSSGDNKIWAFISEKNRKEARNKYLTKNDGQYHNWILNDDGTDWSTNFHGYFRDVDGQYKHTTAPQNAATPLIVNVPAGAFAKDPPKWEKAWVNNWFRSKPLDQCDYRRRRLLAYTIQPVVMLLDVLVVRTLLSLVAFLWLSRNLSFKYFLHPLTYSLADTMDVLRGGTWTVAHLKEDQEHDDPEITFSYAFRKLWKIPLMPAILLPLWLAYHFHFLVYVLIVLAGVIALLLLVLFLATGALKDVWDSFKQWWEAQQVEPTPWYMEEEGRQLITCDKSFKNRTSVAALPAKHRTIRLRFQDLKSKVCRPFSA